MQKNTPDPISLTGDPVATRGTLAAVGIVTAIALGLAIGSGNLLLGAALVFASLGLVYMLFVRHNTWQLALLICYLQFAIEPGFKMGPTELTGALGIGLVLIQLWYKRPPINAPFFESNAFRFCRNMLFVWLCYAFGRFIWNYAKPFNPEEYGFANAIKSEFTVTGVMLVLWLFCLRPWNIVVRKGFTNVIAVCLLVGLLVNIAIRIYGIKSGVYSDDINPDEEDIGTVLNIPGIHLTESIYALRFLGPVAVLFGVIFLSSSRQKQMPITIRFVNILLIIGGLVGSATSGGRASVLFACALGVGILVIRRKILALGILGVGLFAGFCALNVFSEKIVSDPSLMVIERSFYWAMIDRPEARAAADSINSSTDWRQMLFNRAIEEWRSNPFETWLGRGTYKMRDTDWLAGKLDPDEASLDLSLRRGATHNLISDLLVTYGIVGAIIYFVVCIAIIRLCWRMYTHPSVPDDARDLALFSAMWAVFAVLQGVVAGVYYGLESGWLIVIVLARISYAAAERERRGQTVPDYEIALPAR
jgi:hypothetical protein